LSIGLPSSFIALANDFPLLADLDERVWAYVDQSVAMRLASLVIAHIQQMRDAPYWKRTHFPRLIGNPKIEDLILEEATYECFNCMFSRLQIEYVSDLTNYDLDRLVSEAGMRPLADMLAAVRFCSIEEPAQIFSARLSGADLQYLAARPSAWPTYSRHLFPQLSEASSLDELPLTVRARNCVSSLITQGIISQISDLSHLTLSQLMGLPNFGIGSLSALLQALSPLAIDLAPTGSHGDFGVGPKKHGVEPPLSELVAQPKLLDSDFFEQCFPQIPEETTLADLALDVRTSNCVNVLIEEGVINRPSDLSRVTIKRVLRTKNFGRKSVRNLLAAFELFANGQAAAIRQERLPQFQKLCAPLTHLSDKLGESRVSRHISCRDIRLSRYLLRLLSAANNCDSPVPLSTPVTLHQVARRLSARTTDPPEALVVAEEIRLARLKIAEVMRMGLEAELRSFMATRLKDRNLEIVLAHLGWTGGEPKTLQDVGDNFSLTRERVRQIVAKFDRIGRPRNLFLPSLLRVLRFIARRIPSVATDVERGLRQAGLTCSTFRLESIIDCAERFGLPVLFAVDKSSGVRVLTEVNNRGLTRLITSHARRLASKHGVVNIFDLKEAIEDGFRSNVDMNLVSGVVRAMQSFESLGKDWFWLSDAPRNHLLSVICKVLAVAPRVHVSEMRDALNNDPRGMGFAPPKEVVLTFCKTAANCVVEDDFLLAQSPGDPRQLLSQAEQVIYGEFRRRGPLLSRADLERLCSDGQINRTTLGIYLGRSPIVARYAPGVYGLRGAAFSASDVPQIARSRQRGYVECGWTDTANPWTAIRITSSTLINGVIQLPAGIRQHVDGIFVLKTEDGAGMGRLVVTAKATWGLGPLFRRRGGEAGDILLLTFDLQQRVVTARLGDLTIMPEPSNLIEEVAN
jgi:hypothetical protein